MTTSLPSHQNAEGDICNGYFQGLDNWTASWVSYEVAEGETIEVRAALRAAALVITARAPTSDILLISCSQVEVTKLDGPALTTAVVVPSHKGVASVADGKATLTVNGPQQLTVDINGAMQETNTGLSQLSGASVPVTHTFTLFANPMITDRPSPSDPDVRVVRVGETPPATFSESTLYFEPGVHEILPIPTCCSTFLTAATLDTGCRCTYGNTSDPGNVASYLLLSNKRYYIPTDSWIDGWFQNEKWGIGNVHVGGYGVISGRKFQRRRCHPNNHSPKGLHLRGMYNSSVTGLTFVDGSNHHIITVGFAEASRPYNNMTHVKVRGLACVVPHMARARDAS